MISFEPEVFPCLLLVNETTFFIGNNIDYASRTTGFCVDLYLRHKELLSNTEMCHKLCSKLWFFSMAFVERFYLLFNNKYEDDDDVFNKSLKLRCPEHAKGLCLCVHSFFHSAPLNLPFRTWYVVSAWSAVLS